MDRLLRHPRHRARLTQDHGDDPPLLRAVAGSRTRPMRLTIRTDIPIESDVPCSLSCVFVTRVLNGIDSLRSPCLVSRRHEPRTGSRSQRYQVENPSRFLVLKIGLVRGQTGSGEAGGTGLIARQQAYPRFNIFG